MRVATFGAPENTRNRMTFEGSGSEYFRIWIVNLALNIVTLGIFSAWAKVRSRRYLYGNTFITGHNLDYHGQPVRILIGRLIAIGLLALYYITTIVSGWLILLWIPLVVLAAPELVRRGLRFNARNTSYRNLRFDFHGSYWAALLAFVIWPALSTSSAFLLLPLGHRARLNYQMNNLTLGGRSFFVEILARQIYALYLVALIPFLVMSDLAWDGIGYVARMNKGVANMLPDSILGYVLFSAPFVIAFALIYPVVKTLALNIALNRMTLDGDYRFDSEMTYPGLAWMALSNLVLTLATLGLFHPWARVRMMRYLTRNLTIVGSPQMDGFLSSAQASGSAVGEEVAGLLDMDIGF